jgi:parvulin-like peptidyl-prolyl isomerase
MRPVILLLAACITARAADPATVIGKAGDLELKAADVREAIAGLDDTQQAALAGDRDALNQYVRALLIQRLVLQQARAEKWDQQPAVIARLVRAREAALAESFLENASAPEPGWPAESDLRQAYESNKEKFLIPKACRIAQIFIECAEGSPKETEDAARAKLTSITNRLAAKDADFAAIARSSSDEPASAANGGEVGWLTDSQIQPEIRAKIPALKLNEVSSPIRLAGGWHIIKLLDTREARTPALDEVRDELVTILKQEKSRINRQKFINGLLEKHPLAVNEIEIARELAR